MKKLNKIVMIFGIIIAVAGIIFTLLPHELHNAIVGSLTGHSDDGDHMEEHGSHETHQIIGMIIAIMGIAIIIAAWKIF